MNGTRKITMVTRIYHSREDLIARLHTEEERVQWQNTEEDEKKINEAAECLVDYSEKLDAAIEDYLNAMYEEDEEAPSHMAYCRRELIERWALTQAALSKLAYIMRFDGNDAYQRMINALDKGDAVDMRGL